MEKKTDIFELVIEIWVKWSFNYYNPEKLLKYISERGGTSYEWLCETWDYCYQKYGSAAFQWFFCELDKKNTRLLIEYVFSVYAPEGMSCTLDKLDKLLDKLD